MNEFDKHIRFMKAALKEAKKCSEYEDVPVGAVVVHDSKIIGRGYNQVEKLKDSTAHAELIAIKKAIRKTGYKYLNGCTIYVTLEPCPMCAGAIVLARINTVVFGAGDPKAGSCGTLFNIIEDKRLNHRCEVVRDVMEKECAELLKEFFQKLRGK